MFSSRGLLSGVVGLARRVPVARQQQNAFPTANQLFRSWRCLSTEHRAVIDKAVAEKPIVVFMKGTPDIPQCGFSRAVIQVLEINGVDFGKTAKTYNVLEDDDLRQGIKEYSEWPTIPQVYVGGEFLGGCDIVLEMHTQGELAKKLEEHNVVAAKEDK